MGGLRSSFFFVWSENIFNNTKEGIKMTNTVLNNYETQSKIFLENHNATITTEYIGLRTPK